MSQDQARFFLVEDSLEHLEKSKGAQMLIHYPEIIQEHSQTIKYYDETIAQGEKRIAERQTELDILSQIKGLKYFFNKASIERDKANIAEEIKSWGDKIEAFIKAKRELVSVVKRLKTEINEFMKLLIQLNIDANDVIEEYYRIKQRIESGENLQEQQAEQEMQQEEIMQEPAVEQMIVSESQKEEKPAQKSAKKPAQKSAIEKFNSRMAKHKKIVESQQPQQPSAE